MGKKRVGPGKIGKEMTHADLRAASHLESKQTLGIAVLDLLSFAV